MTTGHESLIREFYQAFARRDATTMAAAYLPTATFSDPVFGTLEGARIGAMWRMLCARAADLSLSCEDVSVQGDRGRAHWEARYSFSATGRKVHNVIEASFVFEAGKIRTHIDRFSLYRWSAQALGLKGALLGWSPLVQNAIRGQAARGLAAFIAKEGT